MHEFSVDIALFCLFGIDHGGGVVGEAADIDRTILYFFGLGVCGVLASRQRFHQHSAVRGE